MYYRRNDHDNEFEKLVCRVERTNACHNPLCTTCGADALRSDMMRVGIHFLLEDFEHWHNRQHNENLVNDIKEIMFDVARHQYRELSCYKYLFING